MVCIRNANQCTLFPSEISFTLSTSLESVRWNNLCRIVFICIISMGNCTDICTSYFTTLHMVIHTICVVIAVL